jgi:hypothetical protein
MRIVSGFAPLLCSIALTGALYAQETQSAQNNGPANGELSTATIAPATVLNEPTRGVVFKTAAMNSNGSIASCFRCVPASTVRLGVGIYQVAFDENVQAVNGWSRWVQVDTLSTGSVNAWCTTADRAGVPHAIWVSCQTPGGPGSQGNSKPIDVSYFLFVAR